MRNGTIFLFFKICTVFTVKPAKKTVLFSIFYRKKPPNKICRFFISKYEKSYRAMRLLYKSITIMQLLKYYILIVSASTLQRYSQKRFVDEIEILSFGV